MASATATRYGLSRGLLGLEYDRINISDSDSDSKRCNSVWPRPQDIFTKAKSVRRAKENTEIENTKKETALRDTARRAASVVADDVATTYVVKTSRSACTEDAIAR